MQCVSLPPSLSFSLGQSLEMSLSTARRGEEKVMGEMEKEEEEEEKREEEEEEEVARAAPFPMEGRLQGPLLLS